MPSGIAADETKKKKRKKMAKKVQEDGEGKPTMDSAAASTTDTMELPLGDAAEDEQDSSLKVSEKYAKTYNAIKDRQELAKSRRVLEDEASDSSDTASEDEAAELLTPKVETKIFETLNKIKSRDPSIYDSKTVFFSKKDFEVEKKKTDPAEGEGGGKDGDAKKSTKYKDFLRETLMAEGADAIVKEEEALDRKAAEHRRTKRTPNQEQEDLKASLLAAAHGGDNDDDDDDDDLFSMKEKTEEELREEEERYKEFMAKDTRSRRETNSEELMSRYWKADDDLDGTDRFLRDYVMNKAWLDTGSLQAHDEPRKRLGAASGSEDSDDSEEEHLEKADDYEREYNFRFEVEEGTQIQSHVRFPTNSVRERPDKRKRQRKEKAERKDAEKIRRTEELKRLKNIKKQEIQRRLKQLQEVTGNEETAFGTINLDEDFDPDKHDQEMGTVLGEDYDEREETLKEDELAQAPAGLEADLDVSTPAGQAAASGAAAEEAEDGDDAEDQNVDDQTWWLCDGCRIGIVPGKRRFDCTVCEDFTLCAKCFRVRRHPHKFVRKRVPAICMPPEDLKDVEPEKADQGILDEYFQLDYEDIIGGDLPTRFKYQQVPKNSFGMSIDEILQKEDTELNRRMPLKKLRTYRDDTERPYRPQDSSAGRGAPSRGVGTGSRGGRTGRGNFSFQGRGRGGARGSQSTARHRDDSDSESDETRMSAQRLGAYNLQADRKYGTEKRKRLPET